MTPEDRNWRQQAFLDWLCTIKDDRVPPTQEALAEQLGVPKDTLTKWKADPEFLARWEHQYRRTVGSPERMQTVLQRLYETAVDRTDPRQVQAAKEYRAAVEGVAPQQVTMTIRKDLREMSDAEFEEVARNLLAEEKAKRDADT